jgi:predicted nucleic acid-binding protein
LSDYILDASVAVKWFVEEAYSENARRVLASAHALIAPDFMPNEAASAFLKKIRRREMRQDIAVGALPYIVSRTRLEPVTSLTAIALEFALEHDRSLFDSFYVILALRNGHALITADSRLYNGLHSRFAQQLVWIGDFSE